MRYITVNDLEKSLQAFVKFEIIQLSLEDSWLRFCTFSKVENNIDKYVIDTGDGEYMVIYIDSQKTALIRGYDHQSNVSAFANKNDELIMNTIYKNVPRKYEGLINEQEKMETSFLIWNETRTVFWNKNAVSGKGDGGLNYLLGHIFSSAKDMKLWADDYHERKFDKKIVKSIFDGQKITEQMIKILNPHRNINEALIEISRIDDGTKKSKKYV